MSRPPIDLSQLLDSLAAALAERVNVRLASRGEPASERATTAPNPAAPASFMTVGDVARELSVTEATVRGWIRRRALRAVQLGPRGKRASVTRIARADFDAFVRPDTAAPLELHALARRIAQKRGA